MPGLQLEQLCVYSVFPDKFLVASRLSYSAVFEDTNAVGELYSGHAMAY